MDTFSLIISWFVSAVCLAILTTSDFLPSISSSPNLLLQLGFVVCTTYLLPCFASWYPFPLPTFLHIINNLHFLLTVLLASSFNQVTRWTPVRVQANAHIRCFSEVHFSYLNVQWIWFLFSTMALEFEIPITPAYWCLKAHR